MYDRRDRFMMTLLYGVLGSGQGQKQASTPAESKGLQQQWSSSSSSSSSSIALVGSFVSILSNQPKAPQGWKLWSLLPTGAT